MYEAGCIEHSRLCAVKVAQQQSACLAYLKGLGSNPRTTKKILKDQTVSSRFSNIYSRFLNKEKEVYQMMTKRSSFQENVTILLPHSYNSFKIIKLRLKGFKTGSSKFRTLKSSFLTAQSRRVTISAILQSTK